MTSQPHLDNPDSASLFGTRIARLRKIHGLTQEGLALRANLSTSTIRKVEQGDRPATHGVIAAIARALEINTFDITNQPYGAQPFDVSDEQVGVPSLRKALVEGDDLAGETDAPQSIQELRTHVLKLKTLDREGAHSEAIRLLPELLAQLHGLRWNEGPVSHSVANDLLAETYGYAVVALYRLGHLDLAHLADERARSAANTGVDPLRLSVAEWHHALILLFDGAYAAGMRTLDRAESLAVSATPSAASRAVQGAIHLRRAVLAARQADAERANDELVEAARFVERGQDQANYYGTKFSAANVDIHRVSIPVDLLDGVTAVERASDVRIFGGIAPSRRSHYWIDLSRGWLIYGNRRKSFDALQQARRIAPQITRFHPQVHETVHMLAARDARATDSLYRFAAWCGVRV